jgi:hypothetical protein
VATVTIHIKEDGGGGEEEEEEVTGSLEECTFDFSSSPLARAGGDPSSLVS